MRYLTVTISLFVSLWLLQGCSEEKPKQVKHNVQYVSGPDEVTHIKLGNEIRDTVQAMLKSNLVQAMQNGGPVHAVQFCNTRAMELTNSYSEKYFTEVKRVSDKNRNPSNAPSEKEAEVIADFKNMLANGQPLSPKIAIDADGKKNYYAPIFTGGVCLTCHGNEKNMQPELVAALDSLYPTDKARGYGVDELRGIWSIKFKNS
ncbi:MAG: DUF3365 domain-containing protein [Flavobacteriales bacterium]|nr:DUF3365 domain-containing protein [Flavobacteriales bacterium]MCB9204035.1 DUF3365 domain-containing protein [Flavobacteriales bacterium]